MNLDEPCHKNHDVIPCCEDIMCPCDLQEFERLNAENARLREALTDLAEPVLKPEIYNGFGTAEAAIKSFANAVNRIARAALEGKE